MKSLTTLFAVSLPLCAMAETPAPVAEPAPTNQAGSLTDQLVDSLRQDLLEMRAKKETPAENVQSLARVLDSLIRSGPVPPEIGRDSSWSSQVLVLGSKRSGDLALAVIRESRRQPAESPARAEQVGKQVAAEIFKAKTAAELQPLLKELASISQPGRLPEAGPATRQIALLTTFATLWHTQMAQREAGQSKAALETLRSLDVDQVPYWIDKAEMLRQIETATRLVATLPPGQITALWEKALAADTLEALDPLLQEVNNLPKISPDPRGRVDREDPVATLTALIINLQDALIAIREENPQKQMRAIESLQGSQLRYQQIGVPRSKLLARIKVLQETSAASGIGRGGERAMAQKKSDESIAAATAIVAKMTTLAEIQPNLAALNAVAPDGILYPDHNRWEKIIFGLKRMASTFERIQKGQECRIEMLYPMEQEEPTPPTLQVLQEEFNLLTLRSGFSGETGLQPVAKESAEAYMGRVRDNLTANSKLVSLQTLAAACRILAIKAPVLSRDDEGAIAIYQMARRMDAPGQNLQMAVLNYQLALQSPSKLLPVSEISKRLSEIEKSNPDAFRQGNQMAGRLNDPAAAGAALRNNPNAGMRDWIIPARPPQTGTPEKR